jgi:ribosome assembly protein 3
VCIFELRDSANKRPKPPKQVSEADFNSWYLRQVTRELEEDLDKIRSASDFKDSSLPILITALQQGTALFSPEEKQRLLGAKS